MYINIYKSLTSNSGSGNEGTGGHFYVGQALSSCLQKFPVKKNDVFLPVLIAVGLIGRLGIRRHVRLCVTVIFQDVVLT